MYKVLLIDDEQRIQNILKGMIQSIDQNVEIVAVANSVAQGLEQIKKCKPDIVFLDIEMPDGTGFDLLKKLSNIDFSLIFCTAFDQYAVKAFKYNAIDYILKPFDIDDVSRAIIKVKNNLKLKQQNKSVKQLLSFIKNESKPKEKLVLKTVSDLFVVKIKDIYNCKADGSYTIFMFDDDKQIIVSNSMKAYESILSQHGFIKTHQSHLVNINFIDRIHKTDGPIIILKNGREIPISSRKKDTVINAISNSV